MRNQLFVLLSLATMMSACSKPQQPVPAPVAAVRLPATIDEAEQARREGRAAVYEAALREISKGPDAEARRKALVKLAFYYEESKRFGEAAATLRAAAMANPTIAPYLNLRAIDALREARRFSEAITTANQVIAGGIDAAATEARIRIPSLYALAGDAASTQQAALALETIPIDEFTEGTFVKSAELLSSAGERGIADRVRLRLLTTYPQGRYTEKTYEHLISAPDTPLMQLGQSQLLDVAEKLGRHNRYDQALDLLARIEQKFPASVEAPYYRYVKLRSLFNSRNYADASQIGFEKDEPFFLAAQLLRARAHWRNDANSEFRTSVERLIVEHPQSKEAIEGHVLLSKYYVTDELNYTKSIMNLRKAIASGSKGADGEHLWNLGWTYFLAGKSDHALEALADYLVAYPDADYTTNSLFWSAKIYERAGNMAKRDEFFDRLTNQFPYSYYAYRARQIQGEGLYPPGQIASGEMFPDLASAATSETEAKLGIVRDLLAFDMTSEAARELKNSVGTTPEDPALAFRLAELYSSAGEPLKAMGIVQRKFRNVIRHGSPNVPRRFWEILFPRSYWNEIQAGAAHSGVDPYLMAAIIRQESAFDPSVVSNAGAVGLMQIMPNEIGRIASAANLPPMTRADLFDPKNVTMVGAAEFKQKLGLMNGNTTLAIASYNAGEDAVGRWIAKTPMDDVDIFIESISYAETKLYVKNVTRNYFEYRRIYEQQSSP